MRRAPPLSTFAARKCIWRGAQNARMKIKGLDCRVRIDRTVHEWRLAVKLITATLRNSCEPILTSS